MKEIAERIKSTRIKRNMTQQDLADAMGFKSRSSICHIEADQYEISLDTIKKIASALNVSADWLIFGDEDPKEEITRLLDLLTPDEEETILAFLRSLTEGRAKT